MSYRDSKAKENADEDHHASCNEEGGEVGDESQLEGVVGGVRHHLLHHEGEPHYVKEGREITEHLYYTRNLAEKNLAIVT